MSATNFEMHPKIRWTVAWVERDACGKSSIVEEKLQNLNGRLLLMLHILGIYFEETDQLGQDWELK